MTLLTIRIEGGLLSPDFLETIHDQPGQKPGDFGLDARRSLVDEVTAVWSDVRAYWEAFERRRARAKDGESLTSATREAWVIPLLEALGYRLAFQRRAAEADGRAFAISHRALPAMGGGTKPAEVQDDEAGPPVHIVAFDQKLGERPPAGRGTMSPHALVQDYLNRSDDTWGIVTNGATLRLLRDSVYFSRPSYIEFDLQGMLEGERLDEFILFYRLAHRTRLAATGQDGGGLLERYHQGAVEQGGRIRDGLRRAVEAAILTLANGFLSHPKNGDLRRAIAEGDPSTGSGQGLSASGYYQQLLYLIYRLLFLLVAEERNLLVLTGQDLSGLSRPDRSDSYLAHYSITRLRRLAEAPLSGPQRFDDLYLGLRTLFRVLRDETQAPALGVPALNGELFDLGRARRLEGAYLNNRDLLNAIRQLSFFTPEKEQVRRRVNYAALDVEELGSVYESLLDEHPVIIGIPQAGSAHPAALSPGRPLTFAFVQGSERKTTGSYYTARELVKETLDSALDPVIAERLQTAVEGRRRPGAAAAAKAREARIAALLAIRLCDSACGSGHFLLAAARRLGRALAQVATGEDEPAPEAVRRWTREAIIHCIYGVDKNPLAVDLCKVALWIEGHAPGKPLTFLDAHIKCGDSLVGVFDLKVLDDGIPDAAFDPVTGDDRLIARDLKRRNKQERGGQAGLALAGDQAALDEAVRQWQTQLEGPEDTPTQVRRKQAAYQTLQDQEQTQRVACDLWTAAFFMPLTAANAAGGVIPTTAALQAYRQQPAAADPRLVAQARVLAVRNQFFHWPLEFPHVFAAGGFSVMVGNPPWERIKLQEQEFFAARDPEIAAAPNKAARQERIDSLKYANPALTREFEDAKHAADAFSKFVRESGRFPLTAVGDVNTYALFAELARDLVVIGARVGIIVPTGVGADDTLKRFFGDLVSRKQLVYLIGFINSRKIFPAIKDYIRFGILTLGSAKQAEFMFLLTDVSQVKDPRRRFTLTDQDLALLNPNTRTCPVFRTRADAELTKRIYEHVPVLHEETTGSNPWGISFLTMFHMSNDSYLFRVNSDPNLLRLYEAKMVHHFDHRFGTYENATKHHIAEGNLPQFSPAMHSDPSHLALPHYWVEREVVESRLSSLPKVKCLIGFRDVTGSISERTAIFSVLPRVGVGNNLPLLIPGEIDSQALVCLLANLNSLVFDYVARQKIAGAHMNFFFVKQLPALPPIVYGADDTALIAPRVLELVYTAWDMAPFATDLWAEAATDLTGLLRAQWEANRAATGGHAWSPPAWANLPPTPDAPFPTPYCPLPPFKWDEDRRAVLRAELDAYYARLYGLSRDELRYILDPKDVYGPDFPGETFRVLKEKEEKAFGEYRTRRLVLEAWDRLEAEMGPAVVRNYREEMAAAQAAQADPGGVAEARATYGSPSLPAPRLEFGQVAAARTPPPPPPGQATLFGGDAPMTPPRAQPAAPLPATQPVLIPAPLQGARSQRLRRLLAFGRKPGPEAIGYLVAALADEDEQLRWLAAVSLQAIGGPTVIATLQVYLDQAPNAAARGEAAALLQKLREKET